MSLRPAIKSFLDYFKDLNKFVEENAYEAFVAHSLKYRKYTNFHSRFEIFKSNYLYVLFHNSHLFSSKSFKLELNEFSDWVSETTTIIQITSELQQNF